MNKLPEDFFIERYGLQVRLVRFSDAEFIVALRTDPRLSKYISSTSSDIEQQRQWIRNYKQREADGMEYYFIIQLQGKPVGTSRLYDIEGNKFVSGSWVFSPQSPPGASILGGIICKEIAFDVLGLERDIGDVRKSNKRVLRYNMSYEPVITGEDDLNIYLEFSKENFNKHKSKHIEFALKVMQMALREDRIEE
jgi:hypothetical protein